MGSGETILYVEDDDVLRQSTAEILRTLHFVVIETANGEEAIAVLEERHHEIDLVRAGRGPVFRSLRF